MTACGIARVPRGFRLGHAWAAGESAARIASIEAQRRARRRARLVGRSGSDRVANGPSASIARRNAGARRRARLVG
ncbi:hypothetical protein FFM54_05940 [Burkholderia pseudomallei]|nr:hypothetical protein FFM54_05940 [Burkholderia pseudomallei]